MPWMFMKHSIDCGKCYCPHQSPTENKKIERTVQVRFTFWQYFDTLLSENKNRGNVMYRVSKVLNNNGVIAINMEENIEYVLLGKGIGFWEKNSAR